VGSSGIASQICVLRLFLASAASHLFCSSAPLPWRSAFSGFAPAVRLGLPVLVSVSNWAFKADGYAAA